jgi:hypothetical protein
MRRLIGVLVAGAAVAAAIAALQLHRWSPLARNPDFPPFVMTIEEWNAERVGLPDGRRLAGTFVYRLDYVRRDHWTQTLIADEVPGYDPGPPREKPIACRDGVYGWIEPSGNFTETSRDPDFCNGVPRWIHYGMAWNYHPWQKETGDGVITYSDPGERVVFDATTGLPRLYEAGRADGTVRYRIVYRLDRWMNE